MLELAEAQKRILAAVQRLPVDLIPLSDAAGRFLGETVVLPIDLPPFDNSAVDGYAVQSEELNSATASQPVSLRLIGKVPTGESSQKAITTGECVRIFTGSPLPPGANAVAMQEDTSVRPENPDSVWFLDGIKPWENIRFRGEDVKTGAKLATAGTRLGVGHLSLIGAVGIESVCVGRRPAVGILATGSELRQAGASLAPGEIYESNRIALAAVAGHAGATSRIFPLVPDTLSETRLALENAFALCDVVVTTGGVSVGELDFVKTAFQELGGRIDFWKVSIKPGKPFVFGKIGEKFLFGLPGNPVSALVTFILLAAPALAKMQGAENVAWPGHIGVLSDTLENSGERRHYVRVSVDAAGNVRSAGTQASHILSALAKANGLVEVAPKTVLAKGTTVSVLRLD